MHAHLRHWRRRQKHDRLFLELLERRQLLAANPLISELMAVADGPVRDDDGEETDWIELRNDGDASINLAGWYLTNDPAQPTRWQLPSVDLGVGGHLLIYASGKDRTAPGSPLHTSFTLDGGGGYLALVQPGGTTIASEFADYPDQESFISYGRGPGAGPVGFFIAPTPGEANGDPFADLDSIGLVINEIHYNSYDNTDLVEFVEIYNAGSRDFDLSGWTLTDGVEFTFPQDASIAQGQYRVVGQNAAHLQSIYGVQVVGEFTGVLSNEGERVQLRAHDGGLVDEVDYGVSFPWPVRANGGDRVDEDQLGTFDADRSMELINPSLDNDLGGSWRTSTGLPTPGQVNSNFALNAAPHVRQVEHSPQVPRAGQQSVITAKVTDPDGVAAVELLYQIVAPGDYIPAYLAKSTSALQANPTSPRQPNPAFENPANWTTLVMVDNGTLGDAVAGDGVYTAVVPGQGNRTLVRYRIEVEDTVGNSVRVPYADDPSLNFAYYIYDGVPDYDAATSVNGPNTVYDSETLTTLPVYSLITRSAEMAQTLAYFSDQIPKSNDGARKAYNWEGALVYDGVVYDHVDYRLRGSNGRYSLANKRSMKIRFNPGHHLAARDNDGELYKNKWRVLELSKMFGNRLSGTFGTRNVPGNFGLTESVNNFLWRTVDVPAPYTYFLHMRVVDGVEEAPDQYRGDFWGYFQAVERYDRDFLDEHDLPDGNLYKLRDATSGGKNQQRYQAPLAPGNAEDYNQIESNLRQFQSEQWMRTYVDWDHFYRFKAVVEAVRHYDYWPDSDKNQAYYFYPADNDIGGVLWNLPFDTDASWGPSWNNGFDRPTDAMSSKPELQKELRNVFREFRDLVWQPDQINPVIDYYAAIISAFQPADRDRWRNAPASEGSFDFGTLESKVADMKLFAFTGNLSYPGGSVGAGGRAAHLDSLANDSAIPSKPTISYTGGVDYPINELTFQSSAFVDPQGAGTFGAIKFRIAEVDDPDAPAYVPGQLPRMEYDAAWETEFTTFTSTVTIPAGAVKPGHAYRVRVQTKDNTNRTSHWSEPIQFVASEATATVIDNLAITEIHYNPAPLQGNPLDNDEYEFVELKNTGSETIDLNGVAFTNGVDFAFAGSNVTSLDGGEYVLVVRNQTAFQTRYPSVNVGRIAGEFVDSGLANDGEGITLVDGTGRELRDFNYGGGWYDLEDGEGFSLTLRQENADADTLDDQSAWRPSSQLGGSPAAPDSGLAYLPGSIVINEVLAHTDEALGDWIELRNTTNIPIDVGGWFLSDQVNQPTLYQIPANQVVPVGGFRVFTQSQHFGGAFALSELGDELYLRQAVGGQIVGFLAKEDFGASEQEVTLGRYIKSTGTKDFVALTSATMGMTNAPPIIGPVVIQEIFYNPAGLGSEFVELRNITQQPVALEGWHFEGIDYTFPAGASIAAGEVLLISPLAPQLFRDQRGLPDDVVVFGPYEGALDNAGESLRLLRPGTPEPGGFVPSILVDRVTYNNKSPWPPEADGQGASLQRLIAAAYGNDPINWAANTGGGTPGDRVAQVAGIRLSGRQWTSQFLQALADAGLGTGGWAIAGGANQSTSLPNTTIDRIAIQFTLDVNVEADSLQLSGVNTPDAVLADFQYDDQTFVATWTLQTPLRTDKLLVHLVEITDLLGRPLDGNWTDGTSQFPSGNGILESDERFLMRINVLAGDATADGMVSGRDVTDILGRLSTDAGQVGYAPRQDLDGNGRITMSDVRAALARLTTMLPAGEPTPSLPGEALTVTDDVFDRIGQGGGTAVAVGENLSNAPAPTATTLTASPAIGSTNTALAHDPLGALDRLQAARRRAVRRGTLSRGAVDAALADPLSPDNPWRVGL